MTLVPAIHRCLILHRFPVDQLKIDRSFINDIAQHRSAKDIVTSIIQLASNLGIQSVVEGLETESQQDLLTRMRCDLGQGYLLGHPMSATDFGTTLARALESGDLSSQ